ncbi:unnamed protein product [Caenorhabditis sp. 36 PRJEB53466]|nr:unnamed protein product [Caenorhabditis sp. 36 PRJEB53466]
MRPRDVPNETQISISGNKFWLDGEYTSIEHLTYDASVWLWKNCNSSETSIRLPDRFHQLIKPYLTAYRQLGQKIMDKTRGNREDHSNHKRKAFQTATINYLWREVNKSYGLADCEFSPLNIYDPQTYEILKDANRMDIPLSLLSVYRDIVQKYIGAREKFTAQDMRKVYEVCGLIMANVSQFERIICAGRDALQNLLVTHGCVYNISEQHVFGRRLFHNLLELIITHENRGMPNSDEDSTTSNPPLQVSNTRYFPRQFH